MGTAPARRKQGADRRRRRQLQQHADQSVSAVRGSLPGLQVTLPQAPRGRLADMVAIVTGGGSRGPGIGNGRAAAILFAREGARVVLVDRVAEWAEQTLGMIADEPGEALVAEADVTSDADCRRVVDQAEARFGTIDIPHNNVGTSVGGSILHTSDEDVERIMGVNVEGIRRMSRQVIPVMAEHGGGAIVNVSSVSAIRPRGLTAYTTSKGAV